MGIPALGRYLTRPTTGPAQSGTAFFSALHPALGRELWKTDGTAKDTVPVQDIAVGAGSSFQTSLTISGDRMFFVANDGPAAAELWSMPGFVQNASGPPFSFFRTRRDWQ